LTIHLSFSIGNAFSLETIYYITQKGKTNQTFYRRENGRQNLEFEENNSLPKASSTIEGHGAFKPHCTLPTGIIASLIHHIILVI